MNFFLKIAPSIFFFFPKFKKSYLYMKYHIKFFNYSGYFKIESLNFLLK